MTIQLNPVKSSQIAAVGYDADKEVLAIRFNGGLKVYHYEGVSQKDFDKFNGAESIGKHFHAHIRGKFKHTLQPEPKQDGKA